MPAENERWITDELLSCAARGYLGEALHWPPGQAAESVAEAAARFSRERGHLGTAESGRTVRAIFAELERAGYRHRVARRGRRGRVATEVRYYAGPAAPCGDAQGGGCLTCREGASG